MKDYELLPGLTSSLCVPWLLALPLPSVSAHLPSAPVDLCAHEYRTRFPLPTHPASADTYKVF